MLIKNGLTVLNRRKARIACKLGMMEIVDSVH